MDDKKTLKDRAKDLAFIDNILKFLKDNKYGINAIVLGVTYKDDADIKNKWTTFSMGSFYDRNGLLHVLNNKIWRETDKKFSN